MAKFYRRLYGGARTWPPPHPTIQACIKLYGEGTNLAPTPPHHTSVYKIRRLCGDVFSLVFNKSCPKVASLLISYGVLFSHVDRFLLTAPSQKLKKPSKGLDFNGNDRCCLAKSQGILKAFGLQIQNRYKIYLLHLNLFGLW